MSHNEDRELQIKLVELQIRQQYTASFYTVVISVFASIGISCFIGYLTLGFALGRPLWIAASIIIFALAGFMVFITFLSYKKEIDRGKQQIQKLKKRYVW